MNRGFVMARLYCVELYDSNDLEIDYCGFSAESNDCAVDIAADLISKMNAEYCFLYYENGNIQIQIGLITNQREMFFGNGVKSYI